MKKKKVFLILLAVFVALGVFSCVSDLGDTEEDTEQTTAEAAILPETDAQSTTTSEQATVATTTEPVTEETTTVPQATTKVTTKATTPTEPMVWIPQSGSKFHSRAGCSNMKNPTQVTLSEAKDLGYTACAKCN